MVIYPSLFYFKVCLVCHVSIWPYLSLSFTSFPLTSSFALSFLFLLSLSTLSWCSPQLTLAYYVNVLKTCRGACLGARHETHVLEAFHTLFPVFVYLCIFLPVLLMHFLSPLCSLSMYLSFTCPFHFFTFPCLLISLQHLPFSMAPSWLQMSSLPPQETHHPPTVLSDWTPKPQNFCIKIQFVLTWTRGVYTIIVSFY